MKGVVTMGRDDNKTGGNNARSLPQTPKNQKIKPADMNEEIAREFDELRSLKPKRERMNSNDKKRK